MRSASTSMKTKWRGSRATSPSTDAGILRRLLYAYWPWWIVLTLPGTYWTFGYWRGTTFYGEYLHATGELGAALLIATLAVTPLRLIFPGTALAGWLLARRRQLGVVTFVYSVLHTGAYVVRQPVERVVEEAAEIAMWTGWLALVLMLPLAVTSNDVSERLDEAWLEDLAPDGLCHRCADLCALDPGSVQSRSRLHLPWRSGCCRKGSECGVPRSIGERQSRVAECRSEVGRRMPGETK